MKFLMAVILLLVMVIPTNAAYKPDRLTYQSSCLQSNGYFGALIIGKGTVDQPIDWSPDKKFNVLGNAGVSNLLEGESGALGFWTQLPPPEYQVKVAYPNGVWIRWEKYPKVITYIPIPPEC